MEQPVAISFLGGFLIVISAGLASGLLARLARGTSTFRMFFDVGLATLSGFVVIFLLPMNGYTLGNLIGWPAALAIGALLPVAVLHLISSLGIRSAKLPRSL